MFLPGVLFQFRCFYHFRFYIFINKYGIFFPSILNTFFWFCCIHIYVMCAYHFFFLSTLFGFDWLLYNRDYYYMEITSRIWINLKFDWTILLLLLQMLFVKKFKMKLIELLANQEWSPQFLSSLAFILQMVRLFP